MNIFVSDLHIHTSFSDGLHSMEENVQSAIKKGMTGIGFSDHTYTPFDLTYCMTQEKEQAYLPALQQVKKQFEGQIEVYLGLEFDGFSKFNNQAAFDYIIGSCHYTREGDIFRSVDEGKDYQQETIRLYHHGDSVHYAKKYFEDYLTCIDNTKPDILGHLDLVVLFDNIDEESPVYRNAAKETMVAALEKVEIFELNTRSFIRRQRKIPYPSEELLKVALEHHGKVILSSDSHHKDTLMNYFDDAKEILRRVGFKEVMVYGNHQFHEVGL